MNNYGYSLSNSLISLYYFELPNFFNSSKFTITLSMRLAESFNTFLAT